MEKLKKYPARIVLCCILAIQLTLLLISGAQRGEYVTSYDGIGYYVWVRSAVIDHDFDFKNDYTLFNPKGKAPATDITYKKTQKTYNHYSAGKPFLCAPGFLIGQAAANVLGTETNGFGWGPQIGYVLNAFFYYALGLLLFYRFLAHRIHWKWALILCFLLAFGSTTGYYVWSEPYFYLGLEFLLCILALDWIFSKVELNRKRLLWGAIIYALGIWVRFDFILFLIPALSPFITSAKKRGIRLPLKQACTFIVLIALLLLPHYLLRHHISGSWSFAGGYATDSIIVGGSGFKNLTSPYIFHLLLSTNNGFLFWSPLFVLGFVGLYPLWKNESKLIILFIAIKLYLASSWDAWDGSGSMGPRTLNILVPIMCWAIGLRINNFRPNKGFVLLTILSCLWFNGLVFQRFTEQMPYYEGRFQNKDRRIITAPLSDTPYARVIKYQFTNIILIVTHPKQAFKMMKSG